MARNRSSNASDKLETAKRIASQKKAVASAYAGLEETVLRFFRWVSTLIDRLIFSNRYLGVFALLIAALAFFMVNYDRQNFATALSSARSLENVNLTARYNSETFEVSGLPSSCKVIITGDAANVNNAASRNGTCLISLEGYTEGTHLVQVTATGFGDGVTTTVIPNEVQITLKKKTTRQFDLTYDYINQSMLDSKYILGSPTFTSGTKINIRASQDTLNSISLVKALIDVAGQTGDFTVEAPLVAYDRNGNRVDAEIVPSTVTAEVSLSSPSKTVPINLRVTGEAPAGFAIDSLSMDKQTTVIYAPEDILNSVDAVTVNLDLSTIVSNSDITVPVTLPSGVSSSDVTMVSLKVTLTASTSKVLQNVPILYRNNDANLGASEADAMYVNVTVTGSESNIAAVTANDFSVYIDVKECTEPGTYNLPINIEYSRKNPFVTLTPDRLDLNITLVERD